MNRHLRRAPFLVAMVCICWLILLVERSRALTVSEWSSSAQTIGDVTFTLNSYTPALGGVLAVFSESPGGGLHSFGLVPLTTLATDVIYALNYTVSAPVTDPIVDVSFGVDETRLDPYGTTYVEKVMSNGLTLTWDLPAENDTGPRFAISPASSLTVALQFFIDANGANQDDVLFSISDAYYQRSYEEEEGVPEIDPSSAAGALSFLGMGLAMLMGRHRRRKGG